MTWREKANTLKKFVGLMEEGLRDAAKAVPDLRTALLDGLSFPYNYDDVPSHLK